MSTTPTTRRRFLGLLTALAVAPLAAKAAAHSDPIAKLAAVDGQFAVSARELSGALTRPGTVAEQICSTVGFLSIDALPPGTRPGDWLVVDPKSGQTVERSLSDRHWATDDGKPVTMYVIMWADDRTGAFGGDEITYSHWRPNGGLGTLICQRSFHRQMPIRIVYTGRDMRYVAFMVTPPERGGTSRAIRAEASKHASSDLANEIMTRYGGDVMAWAKGRALPL